MKPLYSIGRRLGLDFGLYGRSDLSSNSSSVFPFFYSNYAQKILDILNLILRAFMTIFPLNFLRKYSDFSSKCGSTHNHKILKIRFKKLINLFHIISYKIANYFSKKDASNLLIINLPYNNRQLPNSNGHIPHHIRPKTLQTQSHTLFIHIWPDHPILFQHVLPQPIKLPRPIRPIPNRNFHINNRIHISIFHLPIINGLIRYIFSKYSKFQALISGLG